MVTARIYKPARTAMQSGKARTREWMLDYEPEEPREIEPLMGWTASGDMRQQVRLRFDTAEEAIAYCKRHGIPYQVFNPNPTSRASCPMRIIFHSSALSPGRIDAAGQEADCVGGEQRKRPAMACRRKSLWPPGEIRHFRPPPPPIFAPPSSPFNSILERVVRAFA
jgi:hypothetical protein